MLEATLDPGKIYYVEVDPNMGVMKARFSLLPQDLNKIQSDSFKKDLAKCEWVVTENPLHASSGVVADEICGCIPACLASAICSTPNNIRVCVSCFYSYCLACYERSQHLVMPLG
jgi:hypothetical protein